MEFSTRKGSGSLNRAISSIGKSSEAEILTQGAFLKMLALERKRSERSQRRFVLMLLKPDRILEKGNPEGVLDGILCTLCNSTRETDIIGWYDGGATIGVIFTEIGAAPRESVTEALSNKIRNALYCSLGIERIDEESLSFHVYPEDGDNDGQNPPSAVDPMLYPDLEQNSKARRHRLGLKRMMDIVGSLGGLLLCAPILVILAILVKLTSRGPVLFRQQRVGQFGRPFTFLKLRSMHFNNDHAIHKDYVTSLITAKHSKGTSEAGQPVAYKLTGDPRITRIGRFLRRTSLDELPQLFNVLKGDMSLVGPRPPIPYEFAAYEVWHKNRLLSVKPGITGLWQVAGRSRVTFDEMVRLDLRYATSWSLRLDLTILLQTPRAVVTCQGAY